MKLTDTWEMSWWAYKQCYNGNDTEEIRELITNSYHGYYYCRDIKDRPELRSRITKQHLLDILERRKNEINK